MNVFYSNTFRRNYKIPAPSLISDTRQEIVNLFAASARCVIALAHEQRLI